MSSFPFTLSLPPVVSELVFPPSWNFFPLSLSLPSSPCLCLVYVLLLFLALGSVEVTRGYYVLHSWSKNE